MRSLPEVDPRAALRARGVPEAVLDVWDEPHRRYHTLEHLLECLRELDTVRDRAVDERAVEIALWFHDAVYEPLGHDSEERSAALAREWLAGIDGRDLVERDLADRDLADRDLADRVTGLILATRHDAVPEDPDARLVVDVDLSILGRDPERFDRYERDVREEYAAVPEDAWRVGRARVLRGFLDRPRIFSTDVMRDRYEARARENLGRALARLGG